MGVSGIATTRQCCPTENEELNMSKKVTLSSFPSNVKRLLATGLLEGLRKCISGIIKDSGYLCGCPSCNYSEVVNAYEFERHADCYSENPYDNIFLENGKTLCNVIQELKRVSYVSSPLNMLDEVIKTAIAPPAMVNSDKVLEGEIFPEKSFEGQQIWGTEERIEQSHMQLNDMPHLIVGSPDQAIEDIPGPTSSSPIQYTTMERVANKSLRSDMFREPKAIAPKPIVKQKNNTQAQGKKRGHDLHRLIFMPNGLPDRTRVAYYSKRKKMLQGYKQGNGIVRNCCSKMMSPSLFETHAGYAANRQPYRHIRTSNDMSLHSISISLSNGQDLATVDGDDICSMCRDGGELILCDRCNQAFHIECLELQCVPEGDWYCPDCIDKIGPGSQAAFRETSITAVKTN
ncbi:uncharacterized protein LOC143891792 [Tasmannia lanceolata]|uniref:uncharacterized protein LOC143891792 n=1 Tax=Tasmannia lanceolata TaxID=3420 RepID=UPI004063D79D